MIDLLVLTSTVSPLVSLEFSQDAFERHIEESFVLTLHRLSYVEVNSVVSASDSFLVVLSLSQVELEVPVLESDESPSESLNFVSFSFSDFFLARIFSRFSLIVLVSSFGATSRCGELPFAGSCSLFEPLAIILSLI